MDPISHVDPGDESDAPLWQQVLLQQLHTDAAGETHREESEAEAHSPQDRRQRRPKAKPGHLCLTQIGCQREAECPTPTRRREAEPVYHITLSRVTQNMSNVTTHLTAA